MRVYHYNYLARYLWRNSYFPDRRWKTNLIIDPPRDAYWIQFASQMAGYHCRRKQPSSGDPNNHFYSSPL
jgi:hypothetical protein